jgi:hypothetical protein
VRGRGFRTGVAAIAVSCAVGLPGAARGESDPGRQAAAPRRPPLCTLPAGSTELPASALRGRIEHLSQYPALTHTTPRQRSVAARLVTATRAATRRWASERRARAAGFVTRRARRAAGDRRPHYLHAEHRRFSHDGRYLDPCRPEVLIYANVPGRPLVLVGVMFSVPRGVTGRTPAGVLTRWHRHVVCVRGAKRGFEPRADGSCPPGARLREGSEMMHVWFTGDLRSAFAIHAPEPELCAAGLLPRGHCASGRRGVGM